MHLIVFTRYPTPGKTKTRLIPALGAKGAASLQKQLTEHCLQRCADPDFPWSSSIAFTGADQKKMSGWLGQDRHFFSQTPGDLGQRMEHAFRYAVTQGHERLLLIGIDCPALNCEHLVQAFAALSVHDLVLGPAEDGGYYCIGLRADAWQEDGILEQLFSATPWGGSDVLHTTSKRCMLLQRRLSILPCRLRDIDTPDDLPEWERFRKTANH